MDWAHYQDQSGFAFDYPAGWRVETTPFPSCTVTSPDKLSFAVIQPLPIWKDTTPIDIVTKGMFPTANLFPGAKVLSTTPHGDMMLEATLSYRAGDGSVGKVVMVCAQYSQMVLLCAVAAPHTVFDTAQPVLMRIVRTQNEGAQQAPAAAARVTPVTVAGQGTGPAPQPLRFISFTDPQRGSFTTEVPAGWRVIGGLNHVGIGDRRMWVDACSPQGIHIFADPEFPQQMCHFWGWGKGGSMTPVAGGGVLLNLKPGAEFSADLYLKQFGVKRFPGFTQVQRKPRPDIEQVMQGQLATQNFKLKRKGHVQAVETILQQQQEGTTRIASLLTTSVWNGDYGIGVGFWFSMNVAYVTPAPLAPMAEQARTHMVTHIAYTAAMNQITQQDDNRIYANTQVQIQNQWNWFNQQQAAHQAQVAQGDAIMNNYWQQQAANDRAMNAWEHNQAVNSQASQNWSDAMLGNQRLYDDANGTEIHAPSGSNYYWRNPSTGAVVGTETDTPPDYSTNYTQLKKL